MLGRHADAFFRRQSKERILAQPANGSGRSLHVPDRERAGSALMVTTPGRYETPGPQHVVDANSMIPGMGDVTASTRDMLPGMGNVNDMMPGMGQVYGSTRDMLPGMGFLTSLSPTAKLGLGIAAAITLGLLVSKRRMKAIF